MLHEKPDEIYHWKNELAGLEQLPGEEGVDKNRLWEKLHDRLREKPARKKAGWYWMAAACLLLAVALPVVLHHKHPDGMAKNKPRHIREVRSTNLPAITSAIVPPISQAPAHKGQANKPLKKALPHVSGHTIAPVAEAEPPILPVPPPAHTESSNLAAFTDTPRLVATVPAKKKLRVVHINELDTSLEEVYPATKNATAVYQLKPVNQPISRMFEFGTNVSDDLVKIKLSPSN
jgi:hypothetical protein